MDNNIMRLKALMWEYPALDVVVMSQWGYVYAKLQDHKTSEELNDLCGTILKYLIVDKKESR